MSLLKDLYYTNSNSNSNNSKSKKRSANKQNLEKQGPSD